MKMIHSNLYNIYADCFSGVPRISPVLGRTVSGSTFRWHLSHLILDLFSLLWLAGRRDPEEDDWDVVETSIRKPSFPGPDWYAGHPRNNRLIYIPYIYIHVCVCVCVCVCVLCVACCACFQNKIIAVPLMKCSVLLDTRALGGPWLPLVRVSLSGLVSLYMF